MNDKKIMREIFRFTETLTALENQKSDEDMPQDVILNAHACAHNLAYTIAAETGYTPEDVTELYEDIKAHGTKYNMTGPWHYIIIMKNLFDGFTEIDITGDNPTFRIDAAKIIEIAVQTKALIGNWMDED